MTCSIAQIKDKKIILGIDSQVSRGNHKDYEEKMFHYEDNLHVCGAGSMSDIKLFFLECVKVVKNNTELNITTLEQAYKDVVAAKKLMTEDKCESTIIVVYKEECFIIYYDGLIQKYTRDDDLFVSHGMNAGMKC